MRLPVLICFVVSLTDAHPDVGKNTMLIARDFSIRKRYLPLPRRSDEDHFLLKPRFSSMLQARGMPTRGSKGDGHGNEPANRANFPASPPPRPSLSMPPAANNAAGANAIDDRTHVSPRRTSVDDHLRRAAMMASQNAGLESPVRQGIARAFSTPLDMSHIGPVPSHHQLPTVPTTPSSVLDGFASQASTPNTGSRHSSPPR